MPASYLKVGVIMDFFFGLLASWFQLCSVLIKMFFPPAVLMYVLAFQHSVT